MHNRHLADHSVYAVSFILIKIFNFRKLIITCRGVVGGTLINQFTNSPQRLLIKFIPFSEYLQNIGYVIKRKEEIIAVKYKAKAAICDFNFFNLYS